MGYKGIEIFQSTKRDDKESLYVECNNNTGSWYANNYIKVVRVIYHTLVNDNLDTFKGLGIREIYPLKFIKQVISMFCSINNFDNPSIDELRKFVLEKESSSIDKTKYKINMYVTKSNIMKYASLSLILNINGLGSESIAVSEIAAYPVGFILYFDSTETWDYKRL